MIGTLVCALLIGQGQKEPQTFMGAREVLKRMGVTPAPTNSAAAGLAFKDKIAAFGAAASMLAPNEAASQWVALAQESCGTSMKNPYGGEWPVVSFSRVMGVLPEPATWPIIEAQLRAEPASNRSQQLLLLLMFDVLQTKTAAQWQELDELGKLPEPSYDYGISESLALLNKDKDRLKKTLLASAEKDSHMQQRYRNGNEGAEIQFPDFEPLLRADESEKLLRKLLTTYPIELEFEQDGATEKLARKIATEEVAHLKAPQWYLAETPDAFALYEGCVKAFPGKHETGIRTSGMTVPPYAIASFMHFVHLAITGQTAAAVANWEPMESLGFGPEDTHLHAVLQVPGNLDKVLDAYQQVLLKDPDHNSLNGYTNLAEEGGKNGRELEFLRKLSTMPEWKNDGNVTMRLGEEATGKMPLANCLAVILKDQNQKGTGQYWQESSLQPLITELALYEGKTDIFEQALKREVKEIGANSEVDSNTLDLLIQRGYAKQLEKDLKASAEADIHSGNSGTPPAGERQYSLLVQLYTRQGRWQEILDLLDKSPQWGEADLGRLSGQLSVPAVRALNAKGRHKEALRVLRGTLQQVGAPFEAYELLLDLDEPNALATLDKLQANEPYQMWPLLFRAKFLLQHGKAAEAGKALQLALKTDPEDVDYGRNANRYSAYAVIAQIEDKLGWREQAQEARNAVRAGKLYSLATDLAQANFDTAAVELLRQELKLRPSDFIARSKLGGLLASLGKESEGCALFDEALTEMAHSNTDFESYYLDPPPKICMEHAAPILRSIRGQELSKPNLRNLVMRFDYRNGELLDKELEAQRAVESTNELWRDFPDNGQLVFGPRPEFRSYMIEVLNQPGTMTIGYASIDYSKSWLLVNDVLHRQLISPGPVYMLKASAEALKLQTDENNWNQELSSPGAHIARDPLISNLINRLDSRS